ncbi:MAG: YciI family protein [Thermodesulfobacteriota bacterium]|nr:YciI family protein [Thermodesulfobacteriota bacterium]
MLYVIHCIDKKNHLEVRMENRPAHVEYLKSFAARLNAAGPTLDDDGNMNGSVVILDLDVKSDAEDFAANDPYAKAGLFAQVSISTWKKVLPV